MHTASAGLTILMADKKAWLRHEVRGTHLAFAWNRAFPGPQGRTKASKDRRSFGLVLGGRTAFHDPDA
jgi:hypothetical protein